MKEALLETYRYFLKDSIRLAIDFSQTDQNRGVPAPPVEKSFSLKKKRIDLAKIEKLRTFSGTDIIDAIQNRRSNRDYLHRPLSMDELSFLLWATQGMQEKISASTVLRTVPSAGCRHALETYVCVMNVTGLGEGIYRYLPVEHQLLLESGEEGLEEKIVHAALGQTFVGKAPLVFIWAAVPYRMEWRYDLAAHKVILLDAGHVCQNLYLACSAIGAGTCAVGAYNQEVLDGLLGVDGKDEFAIYLAPVGKI
jgi:SagB-type dehydrogenase family enzyme